MSTRPPEFHSKEGSDMAKKWLKEIVKAFGVIESTERFKVKFGMYMLVEDFWIW